MLDNSIFDLPTSTVDHMHGGLAGYLGAVCFTIGAAAFGFLVPALAGYIAFAIADRPGLVPGFVVGAVSLLVGAGFLGGLVGGIIAGFAALWISRWKLPAGVRGLQPVVIIPLLATLISSGLMVVVLGKPLAAALTGLGNWLNGLTGTQAILLGIVLGLMMCFDLGGPVNKAAYVFATTGLTAALSGDGGHQQLVIMATVMAAGMVPPLAMALSTTVRPEAVHAPPSGTTARRPGCSAPRSSPRARSRSRPPTRCGSSPSMMLGRRHDRRDRRGRRDRAAGPARRHLRVLRDQQLPAVPARGRDRRGRRRRWRSRSSRASATPTPRTPPRTPSTSSTRTPRSASPSSAATA